MLNFHSLQIGIKQILSFLPHHHNQRNFIKKALFRYHPISPPPRFIPNIFFYRRQKLFSSLAQMYASGLSLSLSGAQVAKSKVQVYFAYMYASGLSLSQKRCPSFIGGGGGGKHFKIDNVKVHFYVVFMHFKG